VVVVAATAADLLHDQSLLQRQRQQQQQAHMFNLSVVVEVSLQALE
jgi:hypothetical protein